ncbi:MAG TPA: response regulator [Terracidiphilus sp.]|nr:response regulator [Terracidiphilus sp.]
MPQPFQSLKVLVVDDEKSIADSLGLIFSSHGYEVRVAYSAEQALELSLAWSPGLAILDVILPKMNGIDLAIVFKGMLPDCHVILFSGQIVTEDLMREAGSKGHAFDIVAKPVTPVVFLDAANRLSGDAGKADSDA